MSRLVRVEVLRLTSRRLVRVVAGLVLALVAVIVVVDALQHTKDNAAAVSRYNEQRLAGYDEVRANFEREKAGGGIPKDAGFPSRAEAAADPGQCFPAAGSSFDCSPPRGPYLVTRQLPDFGKGVGVICAIVAFLVGASAAGAEWAAGTMQSLLYWEPRRVRVVLGKVLGLIIVIAGLVIAAEVLFTAAALVAGATRGSTAGLTGGFWTSHALLVLRAIGLAGFAGVLGFSIAFGSRVTAAAVGAGFIYFAVLEQLLIAWKLWLAEYLVGPLLAAWFAWGIDSGEGRGQVAISGSRAGITLALYAVAMLTAATLWFRQRDVT